MHQITLPCVTVLHQPLPFVSLCVCLVFCSMSIYVSIVSWCGISASSVTKWHELGAPNGTNDAPFVRHERCAFSPWQLQFSACCSGSSNWPRAQKPPLVLGSDMKRSWCRVPVRISLKNAPDMGYLRRTPPQPPEDNYVNVFHRDPEFKKLPR